jgi:hypothetical protein
VTDVEPDDGSSGEGETAKRPLRVRVEHGAYATPRRPHRRTGEE